jgi:uncharacterized protein (TIGR02147 family)
VPSSALRQLQLELLDKARRAIETVPIEERDCTSITMAVEPARLPEAKKMIQRFRRRMAAYLNTGQGSEVYHLTVQLTPATRKI